MPNGSEERSGREIRLLVLVIVVAVAGLIVLARFQFPAADLVTVSPTPPPLERLSARAPFQELADVVASAAGRVTSVVTTITVQGAPLPAPRGKSTPPPPGPERLAVALRVRADRLLAFVPAGFKPTLLGGQPAQVVAADDRRGLALLGDARRAEGQEPAGDIVDFAAAAPGFAAPSYVLAVEAAAGGPAARPVFIGRLDPITADGWDSPVRQIGGTPPVGPGVFLFTLEGRLIGLTVPQPDGVAIVAAATLDRLARELSGGAQ